MIHYIILERSKPTVLADVKGEGAVKHIRITDSAVAGRQLLMRIYFDGQTSPAVDVSLSDFFANADCSEYRQISSMVICCNPRKGFNSYFEMPYFKGFRIEIENIGTSDASIYYRIDCEEKEISPDSLYFHAQFRLINPLPYKQVYTILDNIGSQGNMSAPTCIVARSRIFHRRRYVFSEHLRHGHGVLFLRRVQF